MLLKALTVVAGVLLLWVFVMASQNNELGPVVESVVFGAIALTVYFAPSIKGRNKHNSSAILVLNIFLGWTLIGWVIALVWAYTQDPEIAAAPAQIPA